MISKDLLSGHANCSESMPNSCSCAVFGRGLQVSVAVGIHAAPTKVEPENLGHDGEPSAVAPTEYLREVRLLRMRGRDEEIARRRGAGVVDVLVHAFRQVIRIQQGAIVA